MSLASKPVCDSCRREFGSELSYWLKRPNGFWWRLCHNCKEENSNDRDR